MIPFVLVLIILFQAYISISRLFRRLSASTMASLNTTITENVNGAQTVRTFGLQNDVLQKSKSEVDNHQKYCLLEMVSDCWLFVRLQIFTSLFIAALACIIIWWADSE